MRFAIYIPGDDICNPEAKLTAVGLAQFIPEAAGMGTSNGPDKRPGIVFSWPHGRVGPIGYMPNRQTWIPALENGELAAGRYWVGFTNDSPPTPDELAWPRRFGGYSLPLGDGNAWAIPSAGMLPRSLKTSAGGRVERVVRKEFRQYFDDSVKWFADLIQRDFSELDQKFDSEIIDYLGRALSLNYRLTPEVISELELFNTENIVLCLRASIDGLKIAEEIEAQKKTLELRAG
jgi:hypothetical protein